MHVFHVCNKLLIICRMKNLQYSKNSLLGCFHFLRIYCSKLLEKKMSDFSSFFRKKYAHKKIKVKKTFKPSW